jgi:hypothetical protein
VVVVAVAAAAAALLHEVEDDLERCHGRNDYECSVSPTTLSAATVEFPQRMLALSRPASMHFNDVR